MVKQITFKVVHDLSDPNDIRIDGKGSCANVKLRRKEGWYIPNEDYSVTWKLSSRGIWTVDRNNSDMPVSLKERMTVSLKERMPYQVCKFPLNWMGKKLTRIVKVVQ